MAKTACQVGDQYAGGMLSLDVPDDEATCGTLTAAVYREQEQVLVGAESLREIAATFAAVENGSIPPGRDVRILLFAEDDADPAAPTGSLLMRLGGGLPGGPAVVAATLIAQGDEPILVEITVADVAEFGKACSAASHGM